MNKLFVYGTLRSNTIHSVIPAVTPFIKKNGKGYVKAKLFDLGGYPAAVSATNTERVYGEILEIEPGKLGLVLDALDEYEEVSKNAKNSLFKRTKTLVNTEDGRRIYAWVYWYNKNLNGAKEIKSGIYRKRKITAS